MPLSLPPNLPLLRRLRLYYLSLPLPFRRRKLAGIDHSLNLYWELQTPPGAPPRRMVQFADPGAPMHVDSVQWHQWLRRVRNEAPSWEELERDRVRREVLEERVRRKEELERREREGRRVVGGGVGIAGRLTAGGAREEGKMMEAGLEARRVVVKPGDGVGMGVREAQERQREEKEKVEKEKGETVEDPWERARIAADREPEIEGWTPPRAAPRREG
ncbi:hypothetical protein BDZ91DRAFT_786212 [Kalaharituber pfeilii]|nr:hypothetical protein BDZ91DRAFT_786212 [Kalaharituber pfeilii]